MTAGAFPAPRRQECLDTPGGPVHVFELGRVRCFCGKQEAAAPRIAAAGQPDEPDSCPRCGIVMHRPSEGGPDTPLCDPCWEACSPYRRGWWAGFDGWGLHVTAGLTPLQAANFERGHRAGVAAAARGDNPSQVPA